MRPGDSAEDHAKREIAVKVGSKARTRRAVVDDDESGMDKCVRYFREAMAEWGWELPEFSDPAIENPIADTTDLPKNYMWGSFIIYQIAFYGLAIYFFVEGYIEGRTSSFITLDEESGVCVDDVESETCCEVPTGVTGLFGADTTGKWSTMKGFSVVREQYGLSMSGVMYTNAQWEELMKDIGKQVSAIGDKAVFRDFVWSLIVWVSFTAINTDRGYLKFYFQGDPGMAFNKPIYAINFGNNGSDTNPCKINIQTDFSENDRKLSIVADLNKVSEDGTESCNIYDVPCQQNPCPGILSLEAMGYDTIYATNSLLSMKLDIVAVTTALAVNMNMISTDNLANVLGDSDRITLLQNLVNKNSITAELMGNTTSYFEPLYAPTNLIYCTYFHDIDATSCLIRMANLLYYPVINHYGFSATGYGTPTACSIRSAPGSAGYYYCNKFDIVVGLIYYPVPDVDILTRIERLTNKPTFSPSARPTPGPGDPTCVPTVQPTTRTPTLKPTATPTSNPTYRPTPGFTAPTLDPSFAPSAKPTKIPSGRPSRIPSIHPTGPSATPTARPTNSPDSSLRPSRAPTFDPTGPSYEPTARPTRTPTLDPTGPSAEPSARPSRNPTFDPTGPSAEPSFKPSRVPTFDPTGPSVPPSLKPSKTPTLDPTGPSYEPTASPSFHPSCPSASPTIRPTHVPTEMPSAPTEAPSTSRRPTHCPTEKPTAQFPPSAAPTTESPTETPTEAPTVFVRRHLMGDDGDFAQGGEDIDALRTSARVGADDFYSDDISSPPSDDYYYNGGAAGGDDYYYDDQGGYPNYYDNYNYDDYYYDYYYDYYGPYGYYYDAYDDVAGGYGYYYDYYLPLYYYYFVDDFSGGDNDEESPTRAPVVGPPTEAPIIPPDDDYDAFLSTDDFTPAIPSLEDSGDIFAFSKTMASLISNRSIVQSDLSANTLAYRAMIDVVQPNPKDANFARSFNRLCSPTADPDVQGYKGGCAMLAINFYGGDNRIISVMDFQPSVKMSYSNTMYNSAAMALLSRKPPTSLVESYYSCVLSRWTSFYEAAGLANANVILYLSIGFIVYMYIIVFFLNKIKGENIMSKTRKNQLEAKMAELQTQKDEIMKDRMAALFEDMENDDNNMTKFKEVIAESSAAWAEIEEDMAAIDQENEGAEAVGKLEDEAIPQKDWEVVASEGSAVDDAPRPPTRTDSDDQV